MLSQYVVNSFTMQRNLCGVTVLTGMDFKVVKSLYL